MNICHTRGPWQLEGWWQVSAIYVDEKLSLKGTNLAHKECGAPHPLPPTKSAIDCCVWYSLSVTHYEPALPSLPCCTITVHPVYQLDIDYCWHICTKEMNECFGGNADKMALLMITWREMSFAMHCKAFDCYSRSSVLQKVLSGILWVWTTVQYVVLKCALVLFLVICKYNLEEAKMLNES